MRPIALALFVGWTACAGAATPPPSGRAPGENHADPPPAAETRAAPAAQARLSSAEETELALRADHMAAAELEAAWARMDPDDEPAQAVAFELAVRARKSGDRPAARRWLTRAGTGNRAVELAATLDADARPADPRKIAVLLPLTGRHAAIGREMKVAIELAAAEPDADPAADDEDDDRPARPAGARPTLRFYDTRGDEAEAERQLERAAADGVAGVLGPVGQAETRAAAARAVEHGVPIGLLGPDDAAPPVAGVYRLWPPAAWEAAEAVRLAVERGHDRLAILHPRSPQGTAQADAFGRAAQLAGVAVVAAGSYDPAAVDLEPDIKRFLGLDPAANQRLRRHLARRGQGGWKSFSPDVPFDLLYIPDDHARAALVASYLPYFNIEVRDSDVMDTLSLRRKHGGRIPSVVQLLGSSGWHHPGLFPRGRGAVDGALVVVPCPLPGGAADPASDAAAAFAERFETRTGRLPGQVAAQAHDAARLFLEAHRSAARWGAGDIRPALQRALRTARLLDGACGRAEMGPRGYLLRAASLVQVEGGEFIPVEP